MGFSYEGTNEVGECCEVSWKFFTARARSQSTHRRWIQDCVSPKHRTKHQNTKEEEKVEITFILSMPKVTWNSTTEPW